MTKIRRLAQGSFLFTHIAMASACVVAEPREGYWDHDHHRWYHEHTWHDCGEPGSRCS